MNFSLYNFIEHTFKFHLRNDNEILSMFLRFKYTEHTKTNPFENQEKPFSHQIKKMLISQKQKH